MRVLFSSLLAGLVLAANAHAQDARIVASVLPQSRSVDAGETATAFATMINASDVQAQNCRIALGEPVPARLGYQTTDPATNGLTGGANTPVSIAPRGSQSFVFSLETTRSFNLTEVALNFVCDNAAPAVIRDRVNSFRLVSNSSAEADIVAQAATIGNDGFIRLPDASRAGVFAVATTNVGLSRPMTVRAFSGADNVPVTYEICQTDPTTGACSSPRAETQSVFMASGQNYTFGVFVRPAGFVPRNPGLYRAVVVFEDAAGAERGSTSVAIQTESGTPPAQATPQLSFPSGQSFQINDVEELASVDVAFDVQGFVLGTDGRAALYQDGQLINRYDSAQTVTLDLPGGQHDIAVRLVDMDHAFVFPDARAEGQVTVSTGGVARLRLAGGVTSVEPFQIVDIIAENIFPRSNVYPGTFEGWPVDVMAAGGGRMGFLMPDMDGFTGNGVLTVNIDGTDLALDVAVASESIIANPEAGLTAFIADVRSGFEDERDAAIARQDIPYADALIATINQLNAIEGQIAGLTPEEQTVALRLLRNISGPQASPLFLAQSFDGPNTVRSCAQALLDVPLRAKKGIIIGFVFVGTGATVLGTTGITPIGAFAGGFTFLAGVALIDAHRTEINTTINECFESELEFELQGQTYTSRGERLISEAVEGAQNTDEVGFVSNRSQTFTFAVRRDPFQNMRQYLGEAIEALESVSAYVPAHILDPVLRDFRSLRDGLSVYYPSAAEMDISVTSGDVDLFVFEDQGAPGAYTLGFNGSVPASFTFQVEFNGRTVDVPAYLETNPPELGDVPDQLRIRPEGLIIEVPTEGNVEAFRIIENPADDNFFFEFAISDGRRFVRITPRFGFLGAEAVEFVVEGRGGSRESQFVTMVAINGFYYPHDNQNGILAVETGVPGRRKRFNCFQLYSGSSSGVCLLRFPTDFRGSGPDRNGIRQSANLDGLAPLTSEIFVQNEDRISVNVYPPRGQFNLPEDFEGTVSVRISQGELSEDFPVDTVIREAGPNTSCDFCSWSDRRVRGVPTGTRMRLPLGITGVTVLDFLTDGPDHGQLVQSGSRVEYVPDVGFTGLDQITLQRQESVPNRPTITYTETVDLFVVPQLRRDDGSLYITLPANQSCVDLYNGPAIVGLSFVNSAALRFGSFNAETGVLCVDRVRMNGTSEFSFDMIAAFEYGSDTLQAEARLSGGVRVEFED